MKSVQDIKASLLWRWMKFNMDRSDIPYLGKMFVRLAAWPLGSYKSRMRLARIKTYISPKADINCPDLTIGRKCYIDDSVTIFGENGRVQINDGVRIHRGTIIEANEGGTVTIGQYSSIQSYCILYGIMGSLHIGQKVGIAAYCSFVSAQHIDSDLSRPIREQGLKTRGDIVIGDGALLGHGVRVMDGVTIGAGAFIGANSVVTKDIPPNTLAVGVPARVIRQRGS